MTDNENKIIGFRAPRTFDRRLRMEAAKLEMSKSKFIRRALADKLAEINQAGGHTTEVMQS